MEKQKKHRDDKVKQTYAVLVKELSKNLQLQKENPGKIVITAFYFYDFWAEYADHDAASNIFIGNIKKTYTKELDALLPQFEDNEPFLKFENMAYTFRPAGVAEYERLKSHPYYHEFVEIQEDYDSWECDNGKLISYAINCGQDIEHAAEVLAILYVDVLRINPFFFSGIGKMDTGIPPFVTVVADVTDKDNLSWEDSVHEASKKIDCEPLFEYFRKS